MTRQALLHPRRRKVHRDIRAQSTIQGDLTKYEAACDVFSFGVVMAELWTGQLQNSVSTGNKKVNFHKKYAVKEEPMYEDLDPALDIDQSLDPLLPKFLRDFADLSIACMAADSDDRPAGDDILKKLHTIWTQSTMDEEERDNDEELEPYITKCLQGRRCQVPVDQGGLLSLLAILLAI
jgi:hypothetical protein